MRPPRSLARQLLAWLLLPLVTLLAINAFVSYRAALRTADEAYDRLLAASVRAIADRVSVDEGQVTVDVPYVALELFQSKSQERIFYRVGTSSGTTITGYDDLPPPPHLRSDQPAFYRAQYHDETVYFAALQKPLYEGVGLGPVLIEVGETSEARDALSREIFYDSLIRQGLMIVVAAIVVWLGLRWGLRPLLRLRERILHRAPTDLSAIDENDVQAEVRPLIDAINRHTERIDRLLAARRRFLDDASHQLRTPLAALKTQAEFGLAQAGGQADRTLLCDIHRTVEQTVRLVNQLLTLARSEPQSMQGRDMRDVGLAAIAREATLDLVVPARDKRIDLGFDAGQEACVVHGNQVLLHELVTNLVDNAIRYTQRGGAITVRVRPDDPYVVLQVEDDGPGIPVEERERVFDRFYRGAKASGPGSGLGLAIVHDIARSHGARIELASGVGGRGLKVTVTFERSSGAAPTITSAAQAPHATA